MAVGWFIAPYVRRASPFGVIRYVVVNDLTPAIRADGGGWSETEVLGQAAVVKVRASAATLTAVAALSGVDRIPVAALDDPLSSLSNAQKNAIRSRVQALGYTLAELNAALPGDLGSFTLRQLLTFIAQRRRKVRYDAGTDTIIDDGAVQPVRSLASVDGAVA
jgi:hypothetical protein